MKYTFSLRSCIVLKARCVVRNVCGCEGAATVELAFTLIFFFLFIMVFAQISGVFMARERVSYSAYAGARANSVGANVGRAVTMTKGKQYSASGDTVIVEEVVLLPMNISELFRKGGEKIHIRTRFSLPKEIPGHGDND